MTMIIIHSTFLKIDDSSLKKGYNIVYFYGIDTIKISNGNEFNNVQDIKREIGTFYNIPKDSFELVFDGIGLSIVKVEL